MYYETDKTKLFIAYLRRQEEKCQQVEKVNVVALLMDSMVKLIQRKLEIKLSRPVLVRKCLMSLKLKWQKKEKLK